MNSHHQACQQAWIPFKTTILVLLVLQLTIVSAKKEKPRKVGLFQGFRHLDLAGLKNITEITSENSKNRSTLVVFHSYTKKASGKTVTFLESLPQRLLQRSAKVQLCMFDCNVSPEECGRLGVEEYPTISLFFHRNKVEYQGKKVFKQLATWIDRRTSIFAQEVRSVYELNSHVDFVKAQLSLTYKQQALVAFCGSPAQQGFTTFNRLSREREYHESYVYSNSSIVWTSLNCTSGDIVFFGSRGWTKYHQNSRKTYSLERFVLKQKYYHIGFLNFFSYARFCQANSQMVVLVDFKMNEKSFRLLQDVATKMAKSAHQIAFYFISAQTREGMSRRMVKRVDSLLGVNGEADKPTLRFVKVQGHHLEKFKFGHELKVNSVVSWLQRVLSGQEKSYLKSQPVKQHHKAFKR